MKIFKKNDKLAEIILTNPRLLPVINRFNIELGVGSKTVEEVCARVDADVVFFLAIVNTYHHPEFFHDLNPNSFSPLDILDYLRKTHDYYLQYAVPKLDELLNKLISSSGDNSDSIRMVKTFYVKYTKELKLHIEDEENRVFPYIQNLVKLKENP